MTEAHEEAARKTLDEHKDARAKSDKEREDMAKGKPTPTQEENDLAALGAPVKDKEDDGSGPDKAQEEMKKKHEEAEKKRKEAREKAGEGHSEGHSTRESQADKPAAGGYQTRQSTPKPR